MGQEGGPAQAPPFAVMERRVKQKGVEASHLQAGRITLG